MARHSAALLAANVLSAQTPNRLVVPDRNKEKAPAMMQLAADNGESTGSDA